MSLRLLLFILAGSLLGLTGAALMRCGDAGRPSATASQGTQRPSATIRGPFARDHAFAYNHGAIPQRTLSPADERYNPVALLREDDLSPREVFESEPRDAAFASVLEQRIQAGYSSAFLQLGIDKKIVSMNIECKTLSCYTSVDVAKEDGRYVYDRINGLLLGSMHTPGLTGTDSPDLARVTFYTLFEPDLRDDRAYRRFMDVVFAHLVTSFKAEYSAEQSQDRDGNDDGR